MLTGRPAAIIPKPLRPAQSGVGSPTLAFPAPLTPASSPASGPCMRNRPGFIRAMTEILSRRLLLGGLLATAATGACAKAPEHSPRPPARPLKGRAGTAPDAEVLIDAAKLGGAVAYLVADAATGTVLEGRNTRQPMPPASTAKTLTTLFAFDRLGAGLPLPHPAGGRRASAAGGRLDGDLVLVGGGDPTLDTEALAALAARARAAGLTEVTGRLRYWDGACPTSTRSPPASPTIWATTRRSRG